MSMQTPELRLKELNRALRRLRGACSVLGDEEISDKLSAVMRRLQLAEVLGNTWIIAVGGSQGAGKTTLISTIYGCGEWLKSNEGRGEKMPVLIQEDSETSNIQGYVRRLLKCENSENYELLDEVVNEIEFQQAICDPNVADMLPILKVPRKYFNRDNQAWLLLPGYEKQDRANRDWQELMRQAMMAAGGCVVVTDETRLANQQQLEIVRDMLDNELKQCEPYIVISKTEKYRNEELKRKELKNSAVTTFKCNENHVIFTGADDKLYIDEWKSDIERAVEDLSYGGQANRSLQINYLNELLGKELSKVLNSIRSKSRGYFLSTDIYDGFKVLDTCLEAFDDSVEQLRVKHRKYSKNLTEKYLSDAREKLDKILADKFEGFLNRLSSTMDTTSQSKEKMRTVVLDSWSLVQDENKGIFEEYAIGLSSITFDKLDVKKIDDKSSLTDDNETVDPEVIIKLQKLGYLGELNEKVCFNNLTKEKIRDIRIFLGNDLVDEANDFGKDASKSLEGSIKMIPEIALEYARVAYIEPGVFKECLIDNDIFADGNIVADGVETLKNGSDIGRTAIKSIAALLAIDVISDGDSDILSILSGQSTGGNAVETTGEQNVPPAVPLVAHPAAVAAAAAAAAAYISVAAISRLRSYEKKISTQAHNMLAQICDEHFEHFNNQFDETMNVVRERIKEVIRKRYHMDITLMNKDRLAKAISDVRVIADDLKFELDSSATGLQGLARS